ncbi:unnamed protein product [Amoebophrya sp. A120]|nr:unnamed protein product [Amoebophrya sp. A120]|eukprot:GSA120T00015177001.1
MHPRTREDRHLFKHKENVERERLRNRTGGYFKYEDIPDVIAQEKSCPAYIGEKERHDRAVAEKFLEERMVQVDRRNDVTELRRAHNLEREHARWEAIDHKDKKESDRQRRLIEDPLIGKKNVSGVPFDIVNLEYENTWEGRKLRHDDEMTRYRGDLRKANLAYRGHLGFNPILGEQSYPLPNPTKPDPFTEEKPAGYIAKNSALG